MKWSWPIILCCFLASVALPSLALAQSRSIEFFGLLESDLKLFQKKYPATEKFDMDTVDNALREMYQTNRYESIEAQKGKGPTIYLVAQPIDVVTEIKVNGNEELSRSEILEKLGISEGKGLPKKQILAQTELVVEAYQKIGYLNAKVNVSFAQIANGQTSITVDVREGLPCKVKSIDIETANVALKQKLQTLVKGEIGDDYRQTLAENLQLLFINYFTAERYLNAVVLEPEITFSPNKDEVSLKFVVENPYKYSITYDGNQFFDSTRLSKLLKLSSNERFGLNPSSELADRLRQVYLKAGYANVKVTFDEQVIARDYIKKLKLKLQEGFRVRIKGIDVSGKLSRSESYYRKFIVSHSSDLIELGYYNAEDLEAGLKNLITDIQNEGFLQAKLLSTRSEFMQKGQFVLTKVFLDEGPQTHIKKITFKGLTAFDRQKILDIIGFKEGDALSLNTLENSLPKISEFYASSGYLDMKVMDDGDRFVTYNETNTEASIEFDINEGPKVIVNSILIQGNDQTQESVILKEIEFKPGDVLSSKNINESEFRLQRLGLFSSVSIRTIEKNSSIAQRTVVIEVSERNPGLFNFGASVNNELSEQLGVSISGFTGIAYRNLGGSARAVSGRGELNVNLETKFIEHDVNAGYLEPYIFGDRIRGRVNVNRSMKIFKTEPQVRLLGLETNQISTSLDKDLSRTVKFSWNTWSLATSRKFQAVKFNENAVFQEESLTIATIGPTLEWDLRDNPFSPTSGFFYRLSGEYSDPLFGSTQSSAIDPVSGTVPTVKYYKASSDVRTYTRLYGPRFVWANSVRGGYLQNLNTQDRGRVPEEVMFSLGGRSTIRGFEPATIPPRQEFMEKLGINTTTNSSIPMFVKSDSHYYLLKTEIRFPVYGEVGGVIFYDGGAVRISGIQFDNEYRDAWGLGVRYNTPVGPISAEMAWKLDRAGRADEKESPFRFHFSIGAF
jgi:outer membrane protein insertion porin family